MNLDILSLMLLQGCLWWSWTGVGELHGIFCDHNMAPNTEFVRHAVLSVPAMDHMQASWTCMCTFTILFNIACFIMILGDSDC